MSRIKLITGTVVLCLLFSISACSRPNHIYTDTKDVKIENISHREEGNFLVVSAVLVNKDKSSVQNSVYRVLWFDKNGELIEESAWRPIVIKGGTPVYVKERSTVPGATEYTVLISNDAS